MSKRTPPAVTAEIARGFLLERQGLLADPARRATTATVGRAIESLGFVQLDTINVVERAHQHILMTRFDGYRRDILRRLHEHDRRLFEHWTHDASIIRTDWIAPWKVRFRRYAKHLDDPKTWWSQGLGRQRRRIVRDVFERVERDGPLSSRDFDEKHVGPGWWSWKPAKIALHYLWSCGRVAVSARVNFQKVYDLWERVHPEHEDVPEPSAREHLDWACRVALERLVVASTGEIASFLNAIKRDEATRWCKDAVKRGEIVEVEIGSADGSRPLPGVALVDWERQARRVRDAPDRIRLLSPFDPVVRERKRAERLFGFDYRFEAFVPAPKRQYGYYVLPVLEGDRFVGRLDPKFHRDRGELEIKGVWWEPGVKATKARRRRLDAAIELFAKQIGADRYSVSSTP